MGNFSLKKIVIVGGGSAGWMSAAALAQAVGGSVQIDLIESEAIGTVGVGEATIPPIRYFNERLGISEADFIRHTQGSFKLGIQFINWRKRGEAYFHPFGQYGAEFDMVPFYQYWMRENLEGRAEPLDHYTLAWMAARDAKFEPPMADRRQIQSTYDYAYHFDAISYARFLRSYSEQHGVTRHEGRVSKVAQDPESGHITSVTTEDGQTFEGDLFIDCTGFRGLLIEDTLGTGYEDWSHWLPCNRAVAVPCEANGPTLSYTKATAHEAGWQWRIPLSHRTGNGHVYCADYTDADTATQRLLENLDGKPLAEPRHLRFTTGMRRKFWNGNCVAIGLSAGFMEPLESTSLHLIQYAVMRLVAMLPDRTMSPLLAQEYNHLTRAEYERIRDFLILHYHATERDDSEFWNYCRTMPIPDSLEYKIAHFRERGLMVADERELFKNPSWLAVYIGQGIAPKAAPSLAALRTHVPASERLSQIRSAIDEAATAMTPHDDYLARLHTN
jgi:tryptophan halogenase